MPILELGYYQRVRPGEPGQEGPRPDIRLPKHVMRILQSMPLKGSVRSTLHESVCSYTKPVNGAPKAGGWGPKRAIIPPLLNFQGSRNLMSSQSVPTWLETSCQDGNAATPSLLGHPNNFTSHFTDQHFHFIKIWLQYSFSTSIVQKLQFGLRHLPEQLVHQARKFSFRIIWKWTTTTFLNVLSANGIFEAKMKWLPEENIGLSFSYKAFIFQILSLTLALPIL